jgi:hypothetical protein
MEYLLYLVSSTENTQIKEHCQWFLDQLSDMDYQPAIPNEK